MFLFFLLFNGIVNDYLKGEEEIFDELENVEDEPTYSSSTDINFPGPTISGHEFTISKDGSEQNTYTAKQIQDYISAATPSSEPYILTILSDVTYEITKGAGLTYEIKGKDNSKFTVTVSDNTDAITLHDCIATFSVAEGKTITTFDVYNIGAGSKVQGTATNLKVEAASAKYVNQYTEATTTLDIYSNAKAQKETVIPACITTKTTVSISTTSIDVYINTVKFNNYVLKFINKNQVITVPAHVQPYGFGVQPLVINTFNETHLLTDDDSSLETLEELESEFDLLEDSDLTTSQIKLYIIAPEGSNITTNGEPITLPITINSDGMVDLIFNNGSPALDLAINGTTKLVIDINGPEHIPDFYTENSYPADTFYLGTFNGKNQEITFTANGVKIGDKTISGVKI